MPNVIFMTGNYENEDAVSNLVSYIVSSVYMESAGGYGFFYSPTLDFVSMVETAFRAVRNVNAVYKGKKVYHVIVGFGDIPNITKNQAAGVAQVIASAFFKGGYQVFWGMHFGSDGADSYRHLHLAVNPVSMWNGERFALNNEIANNMMEILRKNYAGVNWSYMYKHSSFY